MLLRLYDLTIFHDWYHLRAWFKLLGIFIIFIYKLIASTLIALHFGGVGGGALWLLFYSYYGYLRFINPVWVSEV